MMKHPVARHIVQIQTFSFIESWLFFKTNKQTKKTIRQNKTKRKITRCISAGVWRWDLTLVKATHDSWSVLQRSQPLSDLQRHDQMIKQLRCLVHAATRDASVRTAVVCARGGLARAPHQKLHGASERASGGTETLFLLRARLCPHNHRTHVASHSERCSKHGRVNA